MYIECTSEARFISYLFLCLFFPVLYFRHNGSVHLVLFVLLHDGWEEKYKTNILLKDTL